MKTGIITYHRAKNVGAALQAYALTQTIKNMGLDCCLIDYHNDFIENTYKTKKLWEHKNLKSLIKAVMNGSAPYKRNKKFDEFNKKYQIFSESVTKETISDIDDIDAYITGSDQVWNMSLNGNDGTFLLDFVPENKKRISYAASFGYENVPEKYINITKNNLEKFDVISVREVAGKKIVENLTNKKAEVVLDPTLLLSQDEWDSVACERLHKRDYVLVYLVAATPTALEFAKKLGKENNCDVICIHYSYKKKNGVINIRDCSPEEFLSYIKYAKYVVASSFHALCFSIIYKKNFFYELDINKNNNNSRLETLMNTLNLNNREIINNSNDYKYENINYSEVYTVLDEHKIKSLNFIKSSLNT